MIYSAEGSDDMRLPWIYAAVLGVYHAQVILPDRSAAERVEFLWVRWLDRDMSAPAGPHVRRLRRLSFASVTDRNCFGFVDPATVIRGCHVMPAFHYGRANTDLSSNWMQSGGDWAYYYVSR